MSARFRTLLAACAVAPLVTGAVLLACSSSSSNPIGVTADATTEDAGDEPAPDEDSAPAAEAASDAPIDTGARGTGDLGSTCTRDSQCEQGLGCWTYLTELDYVPPHFPAHGMCTAHCALDRECETFAAGAQCDPTLKVCVEACTPGGSAVDPGKCHGRIDFACDLQTPNVCAPTCNTHDDCPNNSSCAGVNGMCRVGEPPTDLAAILGRAADGGNCGSAIQHKLFRPDGGGFLFYCAALCTLNAPRGCGWDGGTFPAATYCLPVPGHVGEAGAGDLGECVRLCDCTSDCTYPLSCLPMGPDFAAKTGHNGSCVDKARVPDASPIDCPADAGPG